jgi:plasmid stabilization system protein ParE
MAYVVKSTPHAERDLEQLYQEINAEYSGAALQWYSGLREAILSLEWQPHRCPVAPEARKLKRKLRHLLYGKKPNVYRIIYELDEHRQEVRVITIRHGARRTLKRSDLV